MTDPIDIINFAIENAMLVVAALGFLINLYIPYTERLHKRFFTVCFFFGSFWFHCWEKNNFFDVICISHHH